MIIWVFFPEWVNEDKIQIQRDEVGDKKYIHICNEEGVIPVTYFLKHIQDSEFVMRFHGLGPLGAKAIAFPLKVTISSAFHLKVNKLSATKLFLKCNHARALP